MTSQATTKKTPKIPQYDALPTDYDYFIGASALLFSGTHSIKALRVEVPDLGKEFSDTQFIGTDPEGVIYYNDVREFDTTLPVYYKIYHVAHGDKDLVQIKLSHNEFKQGQADPACHAEFWANDTNKTVAATGMDKYTNSGKWYPLDISTVVTTFTKYGDMSWVSVAGESVAAVKGTIDLPKGLLQGDTFVVHGNLTFREETSIRKGKYANYNNDRVVFYTSDYVAKDFTSYFIPFETHQESLGVPADQTRILNVTWN
ncbi:hypothetical protein C8R43DRAFT_1019895 [Mycena crocata]|nr:hypothetical protein C8R43DRAFT_1019895 [Mycena crocata]